MKYFDIADESSLQKGFLAVSGTLKSNEVEVKLGNDITLECEGGCWSKGSALNNNEDLGNLKLENVIYQDAGKYWCITPDKGLHNNWKAEVAYQINVKGMCQFIEP